MATHIAFAWRGFAPPAARGRSSPAHGRPVRLHSVDIGTCSRCGRGSARATAPALQAEWTGSSSPHWPPELLPLASATADPAPRSAVASDFAYLGPLLEHFHRNPALCVSDWTLVSTRWLAGRQAVPHPGRALGMSHANRHRWCLSCFRAQTCRSPRRT